MSSNSGRYYRENFKKKKRSMPAALVIGVPTDVHIVAAIREFRWPGDGDEYEFVGGFRGEPMAVRNSNSIAGSTPGLPRYRGKKFSRNHICGWAGALQGLACRTQKIRSNHVSAFVSLCRLGVNHVVSALARPRPLSCEHRTPDGESGHARFAAGETAQDPLYESLSRVTPSRAFGVGKPLTALYESLRRS